MWCRRCGQDVPGVPALDEGEFSCPRCGEILKRLAAFNSAEPSEIPLPEEAAPPDAVAPATPALLDSPAYDQWELEEQLRHIGRVLRKAPVDQGPEQPADGSMPVRLDTPHETPAARHVPHRRRARGKPARQAASPSIRGSRVLAAFTVASLLLGTMTLACGGILLGWALVAGRPELWNLGMPIALGGQIALLIGLVLQLERLWSDNRRAASRLEKVHVQLDELRTTTTRLGTPHGPSAAFYAHLAGGAGPKLLLSDLKGQLDLLAARLAEEK